MKNKKLRRLSAQGAIETRCDGHSTCGVRAAAKPYGVRGQSEAATPLWLTHANVTSHTSDARKPKRRRRPAHAGLCRRTPKRRAARFVSVVDKARLVSALSIQNCHEKQEVACPERTAFAVRRNAKAFRSRVAGEARLVKIALQAGAAFHT